MHSGLVQAGYDAVAEAYAERFRHELDHKPFDRNWLDRFATLTRGAGAVCEAGCGPGQVAWYLHQQGVRVFGVDLSAQMVRQARRLHAPVAFQQHSMLHLGLRSDSLGGIAAFYSIVHFTLEQVALACREFHRVLVPGGYVLLAFHIGDETRHVKEFLGRRVAMDFAFFQPDEIVRLLEAAALPVQEVTIRYPYKDVEVATKRAYVLARK